MAKLQQTGLSIEALVTHSTQYLSKRVPQAYTKAFPRMFLVLALHGAPISYCKYKFESNMYCKMQIMALLSHPYYAYLSMELDCNFIRFIATTQSKLKCKEAIQKSS